ncbi:MAG TPA: energy transducer TonB [Saccharospirillum sp.]|nr:energy transducer TonB [Saccharospirillum sp.]
MPPTDTFDQRQSGPVISTQTRQTGLAVGVSLLTHLVLAIAITQTQTPATLPVSQPSPPPPIALQLTQAARPAPEQAPPAILQENNRVIASSGPSTHTVSAPEPEPKPEPQQEPEQTPEPLPEPEPEPTLEPIPEPAPEPETIPEPEPEPEPEIKPEPFQIANQTNAPLPANAELSDIANTSASANTQSESAIAASQQAELREELYNTYLAALMQELRRSFDYPRGALRRRQEGRVQIALRIETDGTIAGVTLDSSSGYNLLDESAIAMIERISGLPALPEEAGNRGLAVSVPIDFKLN